MAVEIKVPALGESVTEATVAKWLVKAGDAVTIDQPLCELETDKVTVEVNASVAGTIVDLAVAEGTTVQVGGVLCHIEAGAAGAAAKPAAALRPRPPHQPRRSQCRHLLHRLLRPPPRRRRQSPLPRLLLPAPTLRRPVRRRASSSRRRASPPRRSSPPARTAAPPRPTCWRRFLRSHRSARRR